MATSELEKLTEAEQKDFLRLYNADVLTLTEDDETHFDELASKLDIKKYAKELRQKEANQPQELTLTVANRSPYQFHSVYGTLTLDEKLVPAELRQNPGERYHSDTLFAIITADLDLNKITSFQFKGYLRKATPEEIASIPTLDSLPESEWPRH
jgi:hypothetical protein